MLPLSTFSIKSAEGVIPTIVLLAACLEQSIAQQTLGRTGNSILCSKALQTKITGLNAILADPDLYSRDPRGFGATTQALAAARDELAAAEEQWLTLEMLRGN